jgi:hypothetical protein
MKTKLKVGVTIFVRDGHQSVWENGIIQNCLFLVRLLQSCEMVGEVVLISGGDTDVPSATLLEDLTVPFISFDAAMASLDVVIEMSAQLNPEWAAAFQKKGGKVAVMRVGNDYAIDIERIIYNKPHAGLVNQVQYDGLWTLPQYEKIGRPYYENLYRTKVQILPHLWSPEIFDRSLKRKGLETSFGYRPGGARRRICIVEPNVSVVKSSFIPMLAVESAHRENPFFLQKLFCFNTSKLSEDRRFKPFALGLDVTQHGLASFEGRVPMDEILSMHCDMVVSHQWENAQNYVYYEALYGGYPLIHNSWLLKDLGYYYSDFDCIEAGRVLLHAHEVHDDQLNHYRMQATQFLQSLQPEYPHNVSVYSQALADLYR